MYDYVEGFPNGDGHTHECAVCGGTIGESSDMVYADGAPMHDTCYDDTL